jgi:hypothetical protein
LPVLLNISSPAIREILTTDQPVFACPAKLSSFIAVTYYRHYRRPDLHCLNACPVLQNINIAL